MRLTVLGSGDASGIPRADCMDPACACARALVDSRLTRRNTCCLIEGASTRISIDTGCGGQECDGLLLTHYHHDHAGFRGDFSCAAWGPNDDVPADVRDKSDLDYFPMPERVTAVAAFADVAIGGLRCTALPLNHPIPVHGWSVTDGARRITWLTDTYGIPARTLAWLADHPSDVLALDTTFAPGVERAPLKGHSDLTVALAALAVANSRQSLLIHIGHGHQTWLDAHPDCLPPGVEVAYDGMSCTC